MSCCEQNVRYSLALKVWAVKRAYEERANTIVGWVADYYNALRVDFSTPTPTPTYVMGKRVLLTTELAK